MFNADEIFANLSFDEGKLAAFGFERDGQNYCYRRLLSDSPFEAAVEVRQGKLSADVIDKDTGEVYALVKVAGAEGAFVGRLRGEFEAVLREIAAACCYPEVFKSPMAKRIMAYVKDTYGDELEFLWAKFPKNAVWRRKDNAKWYAALLNVKKDKIGLAGGEYIDIIDLRMSGADIERLVDGQAYFPGYHMNKKSWITVNLESGIAEEEVLPLIDNSYRLAKK